MNNKATLLLMGMFILLICLVLLSVNFGAIPLSINTLWKKSFDDPIWHIWLNIRVPRVILAIIIGAALAQAGCIMQGLFRNPLADPGLLGISSGAAFAVGISLFIPWSFSPALQLYLPMLAAFIGSLLVTLLIFSFCRFSANNMTSLLLIGIAINALSGAMTGVLSYLSNDQQLRQLSLWGMGSLANVQWPLIAVVASIIFPTLLLSQYFAEKLNILQLGEEDAHYLGIHVKRVQQCLLVINALLVGTAVAVSGIIGFIGLVIPHLMRLQLGGNHHYLLPASALAGAILLLIADTLARTVIAPAEFPVGLLTSLLGGPYFLWLILKRRKSLHD